MIQNIRGTKDLFFEEILKWHFVEEQFRKVSNLFGYNELRTPIFEKTEVFQRSIGETSDIVNKEMYTFIDKGGESITLRPEMTAALVRCVVQHNLYNLYQNLRLWYFGPFFRYERPQKGRLRQFHQYGAECIGSPYPESDAEIIFLANSIINSLNINNYTLEINSIGNLNSREKYKNELINYLKDNFDKLSEDSKNRLNINPLRILDSKDENDKKIIDNCPNILEYLDDESKEHFDLLINILDKSNVKYSLQPKLVRGLDYYSHTVFEYKSNTLGSQDAFGGGGRYNNLIEELGGKPTPAVGFALGVERLILIMDNSNNFVDLTKKIDFYIVYSKYEYFDKISLISNILRNNGYSVIFDIQRKSFKSQLREADKLNAKFVIIIGEDEYRNNQLTLKNLSNGLQKTIPIDSIEAINLYL